MQPWPVKLQQPWPANISRPVASVMDASAPPRTMQINSAACSLLLVSIPHQRISCLAAHSADGRAVLGLYLRNMVPSCAGISAPIQRLYPIQRYSPLAVPYPIQRYSPLAASVMDASTPPRTMQMNGKLIDALLVSAAALNLKSHWSAAVVDAC